MTDTHAYALVLAASLPAGWRVLEAPTLQFPLAEPCDFRVEAPDGTRLGLTVWWPEYFGTD